MGTIQIEDRIRDRDSGLFGTVVHLDEDPDWVSVRFDHDGELCDCPVNTIEKIN